MLFAIFVPLAVGVVLGWFFGVRALLVALCALVAVLAAVTVHVVDVRHWWLWAGVLAALVGVWCAVASWLGAAAAARDEGDRLAGVYFQDGWGRR